MGWLLLFIFLLYIDKKSDRKRHGRAKRAARKAYYRDRNRWF